MQEQKVVKLTVNLPIKVWQAVVDLADSDRRFQDGDATQGHFRRGLPAGGGESRRSLVRGDG